MIFLILFFLFYNARANPYGSYPNGYGEDDGYSNDGYYSTESTEYYPTTTSSFFFETDDITFGPDSFEVCPECENGGVCNDNFECDCLGDFTGELCEGDPCSWTPCLNNGACTVSNVTYECACTEGYHGRQCEITPCHIAGGTPIPETKSSSRQRREEMILGQKAIAGPCLHGGICVNIPRVNDYFCLCWGLEGRHCEVTPCDDSPCLHNGTCFVPPRTGMNYECTCQEGYSGEDCEITPCSSSPCADPFECSLDGSGFNCVCPEGFTGANCDVAVTTTTSTTIAMSSSTSSSSTQAVPSTTAVSSSTTSAGSPVVSSTTVTGPSSSTSGLPEISSTSPAPGASSTTTNSVGSSTTTVSPPVLSSTTNSVISSTTASISTSSTSISTTSSSITIPPLFDWILWRLGITFDETTVNNLLGAYGCASRGFPNDPFVNSAGRPVDGVDKVLLRWKKCIRCAMSVEFDGRTQLPEYVWPPNEICEMGGVEEEICECDKQVATALLEFQDENGELQAPNNNFDLSQCERGPGDGDGGDGGSEFCCKRRHGAFQMYNGNRFCCEFENLLPAGACVVDEGILYQQELFV